MATSNYTTTQDVHHYSPRKQHRAPSTLYLEYQERRRHYPLGERNPYCGKGLNRGQCQRCLMRTLQKWGVDIKTYFKSTSQARPQTADDRRKRTYGLVPAEYKIMLAAQDACCALCGHPESRQSRGHVLPLAVDHNHQTGAVRALLCAECNQGIGAIERFGWQWTVKAARYLAKYMSEEEKQAFSRRNKGSSP